MLAVTGFTSATAIPPTGFTHQAVVAYTTSQPWPHAVGRPGVIPFSAAQAIELGQQRAFILHLWRVAYLPITPAWLPRLSDSDGGVVGHASVALCRQLEAETAKVFSRHPDTVERLGPLRPTRRR
jgi:hypothetical protein